MSEPLSSSPLSSLWIDPGGGEFQIALIRAILEACPDGILVVDSTNQIVTHNQRFFQVWDICGDEVPGTRDGSAEGVQDHHVLPRAVARVKDPDSFLARVKELYANPWTEDHCEIELKDGRTLERHSTGLWSRQGKYLGRVWFFRDITTRKQTETALRDLAQTDPLTGVANRRQFLLQATDEFARARRFDRRLSFVMVDIDLFKRINDRWGHAAGDEVLKALCTTWRAIVRQEDLLARIGGEEFAWLLAETDLEGAYAAAEKLRRAVEDQVVRWHDDAIRFTVSTGVSTLAPTDTTVEDPIKRADAAMYRAKNNGRNCTERQA
jgi:diguanylate cyclase (GGDEF)-like protein